MDTRPVSVSEWRIFLHDYSARFLDDSRWLRELEENGAGQYVREHVEREGWLGYAPADADAIAAAEERLGTRLPLTYRNFLMASNGFREVDYVDLLPVEEIDWLPEADPMLVETWGEAGIDETNRDILARSLLVAQDDGGPGVCWLLYPGDVSRDGEWAAYEWFTSDGDVPTDGRHDNFGALLRDTARQLDAE